MAEKTVAQYLFECIEKHGVEWTFGIPGDFVLPIYAAQSRRSLKTLVMCHEPGIGFAADAYGRLKGLGVALVTYGAGGLNMVNATALAYAEDSPLLVISGSPETRFRAGKPQLHHCVKEFDTQLNVYKEVTERQALIDSATKARSLIDQVVDNVVDQSRPGYLEVARDLVNAEIALNDQPAKAVIKNSIGKAVAETIEKLKTAQQPVLFAGVHLARFGLANQVVEIAEALNLPVVTSILGKTSFPETHPNFVGTYFGKFGLPEVREFVESSDCILCLGPVLTEMETGGYSAHLPTDKLILANAQELRLGEKSVENPDFKRYVTELLSSIKSGALRDVRYKIPTFVPTSFDLEPASEKLNVGSMLNQLNDFVDERFSIVCDVGDCLYAGLSIKTDLFIAAGYYSSMGFGVPAGVGAQLARPERRSIVLVGDGGFQMTGMELSAAVRAGINPIVIVFNNASYAMLQFIDQKRSYYDLGAWDYCAVAAAVGATAMRATTKTEFETALKAARSANVPFLIDAVIEPTDISPTLKRLTDHFGAKVRASIA